MAEQNPRFLSKAIEIVEYDPGWSDGFVRERDAILELAGRTIIELEHFGSTAVPWLPAKPIVDMLAGVRDVEAVVALAPDLQTIGCTDFGVQVPGRRLFARGGPANEATHHLHFVVYGSPACHEPLFVRDRLRSDRRLAEAYAMLKRQLANIHGPDIRGYSEGKADFIASLLANSSEPRVG